MDKNELESIKGLSREERAEFFKKNKADILALSADDLSKVNGGAGAGCYRDPGANENPNSEEIPYGGAWYTSFGFICNGERWC